LSRKRKAGGSPLDAHRTEVFEPNELKKIDEKTPLVANLGIMFAHQYDGLIRCS